MNTAIEFEPMTGCIGAHVHGIDLNNDLDKILLDEIRDGLHQHLVLLFPNQDLTPQAHVKLGSRLGELEPRHPDYPTIEGNENIMVIENGPQRPPDNEQWHKDMSFLTHPAECSLLHAKILPTYGGDTMFCNLQSIYEELSPSMKTMLEQLNVVHDQVFGFERGLIKNGELHRLNAMKEKPERQRKNIHPAIGIHPFTGKKYLGIDDCFVSHFVELTDTESDAIMRFLRDLLKEPRFHARIKWNPNDLAIWDNISTLHYAVGDYKEYRRMQRVTVSKFHELKA